ncbi:nucleoside triphosphate pyrophosphohydrolase [Paenibacillus thermotolerans]|uniref:nucleoside triphosphate pyrophosphohydrolase n=1 Tax=Paenibacillus thermotolerans TaxID=3027807 RepID=UPI002367E3DB|nr:MULTISPECIES: nucleoside triphosphate pyrophosphohydrolase [unclassified Paenibacillus]
MPTYNKLVRDLIPEVIRSQGKAANIRTLEKNEYVVELRNKLHEEIGEYLLANDDQSAVEELADILELIYALAATHGSTPEQLEKVRADKAAKRGGFKKGIFLINVEDA